MFWQHIGASRWLYNYMLAWQEANHADGGKYVSTFGMNKLLTPLKHQPETSWLYEIANGTLQQTCGDVNAAYTNFFEGRAKHPKFKSRKRSKPSYPLQPDKNLLYFKDSTTIVIPKVGKVRCKTNHPLPIGRGVQTLYNPRIAYTGNKWLLTFALPHENQVQELTSNRMGIDWGIKELAVVAYGNEHIVFHNINKSKRMRTLEHKRRHIQRAISRKYEAGNRQHPEQKWQKTKSIEKYEAMLAEINYKQSNIRRNYIHQTTHQLTTLLPASVVMEDLNVKGMMKNRHLAKHIQNACWGEFIFQMEYKSEWNSIPFQQVGRFYPSSKTCSNCGTIKRDLHLKDRVFVCPDCGFRIDRDYNAAINLQRYAELVESPAA